MDRAEPETEEPQGTHDKKEGVMARSPQPKLEPMGRPTPRSSWLPLLSHNTMHRLALAAADRVVSNNPAAVPVAATVTGSRLRGLDHADSDVDVLVLVADKAAKAKTLSPWTDPDTGMELEGQVQSLDKFLSTLSTSVPYVEALTSPVLVASPQVGPLLRATVPDRFVLAAHAQRFAHHAACRAQCPVHKAANHAHAAYALAHGMSGLLDRVDAAPGSQRSLEVAHWLTQYAYHRREADLAREVDRPQDLPRVLAVAAHLKN